MRAAIAKAKRQDDNVFGLDYSAFTDAQLTDDWNPSIFPNLAPDTPGVGGRLPGTVYARSRR